MSNSDIIAKARERVQWNRRKMIFQLILIVLVFICFLFIAGILGDIIFMPFIGLIFVFFMIRNLLRAAMTQQYLGYFDVFNGFRITMVRYLFLAIMYVIMLLFTLFVVLITIFDSHDVSSLTFHIGVLLFIIYIYTAESMTIFMEIEETDNVKSFFDIMFDTVSIMSIRTFPLLGPILRQVFPPLLLIIAGVFVRRWIVITIGIGYFIYDLPQVIYSIIIFYREKVSRAKPWYY